MKMSQSEAYELRIKVNKLLEERQAQLCKIERYRARESDLMKMLDDERIKRRDAEGSEKRAHEKAESLAELVSR